MNFCILISFLSLSISNAAISSIFQDPSSFISSLTDANPATIQKMKDMVADLIVEGEEERKSIIATHETAQARFDAAVSAQSAASAAHSIAAGNVKNQDNVVADLTEKEAFATAKRAAALQDMNTKKKDSENKADIRESEIVRLDSEKAVLQTVLEKLETLLPGVELIEGRLTVTDYIVGRSLLSDTTADRDAVQKIVNKINAMVGVGESQRSTAIKNDEDALAAFKSAVTAHDNAVAEHQAAAGKLASAEAELERLSGVLSVKVAELKEADEELASATTDLAEKKTIRENEEIRLDSEKDTLEQVQAALDRLS